MRKLNVGVDLALVGQNRASVYDPHRKQYLDSSFSFDGSYEGYEYLLKRVYRHVAEGEEAELHFIMEPTGLAWMPLSCFLVIRGHKVYRASTQKSSDFRKFLSKYTKSDRVDTRALARLPEVDIKRMYELYLPTTDLGTLSRKSKHMAKLIDEAGRHKQRIQSLFVMVNPGVLKAFGEEKFSIAGRTLYRYFTDPFKIVGMGKDEFFREFVQRAGKAVKDEILQTIYQASISAVKIYEQMVEEGMLPFDFKEVDEEIQTELRIIDMLEVESAKIQRTIDVYYERVDNEGVLKSIRGIGKKIAPGVLGIIGDVSRFSNISQFGNFYGLIPKKNQSSGHEKGGQKIHKAGQKLLKKYMYMAAESARRWDPECAAFYDRLMRKGEHHYSAICAVANKLTRRVYAVLKRMQRSETCNYKSSVPLNASEQLQPEEVAYQLRDLDGNVVTKKVAREIVLEKFPSKSQREKQQAEKKKQQKSQKEFIQVRNTTEKNKESLPSRKILLEQTRQSVEDISANSSPRSGKTLPAKTVLDNMISEQFLQEGDNDSGRTELMRILRKLKEDIERQEIDVVDNLCKGGVKKNKKNT